MTSVWHLRDANKYGMNVYGSRKGASAQAIYTADRWRKGARLLPCFSCHICFAHTDSTDEHTRQHGPGWCDIALLEKVERTFRELGLTKKTPELLRLFPHEVVQAL